MDNNKIIVTAAPHVRDDVSTQSIMLDVIIALLPCTIFAFINIGLKAILIVLLSVISAVTSETVFNIIVKKKNTINDLSAVVTGLILALTLPQDVNLFMPVIGSVFAIVVAKMLFGGLGQNFVNPAASGRVFLTISFANAMNTFTYDGVTQATPLALARNGEVVDLTRDILGFIPGAIGEVSVIAILIGGIYLLIRRVIDFRIPFVYLITMILFIIIFSGRGSDFNFIVTQAISGGVMFAAFFMATDYVSSPTTKLGRVLFAVFLGIMNGIFRLFSNLTEGCQFSIMLANLLVPFINKITLPKAFGR